MNTQASSPSKKPKLHLDALWLLAFMWALFLVEFVLPFNFDRLAIVPRDPNRLMMIFSSGLLHHNLMHIISNSIPFAVLGSAILLYGRRTFWFATLVITIVGGTGTWLVSTPNTLIVGASGLVFGYWSFLLSSAIFRRSIKAFLIAFVVFIFYGSLLFGLLDMRAHISWAGHFWGMVGGVVAAYISRSPNQQARLQDK